MTVPLHNFRLTDDCTPVSSVPGLLAVIIRFNQASPEDTGPILHRLRCHWYHCFIVPESLNPVGVLMF